MMLSFLLPVELLSSQSQTGASRDAVSTYVDTLCCPVDAPKHPQ